MVPAGNKAKHISLVNHTTKTILHHHHLSPDKLISANRDRLEVSSNEINWLSVGEKGFCFGGKPLLGTTTESDDVV